MPKNMFASVLNQLKINAILCVNNLAPEADFTNILLQIYKICSCFDFTNGGWKLQKARLFVKNLQNVYIYKTTELTGAYFQERLNWILTLEQDNRL